jgi:hypothetical protein
MLISYLNGGDRKVPWGRTKSGFGYFEEVIGKTDLLDNEAPPRSRRCIFQNRKVPVRKTF